MARETGKKQSLRTTYYQSPANIDCHLHNHEGSISLNFASWVLLLPHSCLGPVSMFKVGEVITSTSYSFYAEVPNLWDLVPDDLRWGLCNNNRNKMHNKFNALESSQNHPHPWSMEKLSSTKLVFGAKRLGLLL